MTVTDLPWLLARTGIERILCNGTTSYRLFQKYTLEGMQKACEERGQHCPDVLSLPSTSPANAAWSLPKLYAAWKDALNPEKT